MKINVGCGNIKLSGFVGVDRFPCGAAEILCDITKTLPFRDDSIDEVNLDNVIEHIHDIPSLMREIFRISKPGAIVTIITPHLSSLASWRDSTHVHQFSYFPFDHFTKPSVAHYMEAVMQFCTGVCLSARVPGGRGADCFQNKSRILRKKSLVSFPGEYPFMRIAGA